MSPHGHINKCACSAECRAYRVGLTRAWREQNPEKKRAQDRRYRARHRETLREQMRAYNKSAAGRERRRQWADKNPEKVRQQNRSSSKTRDQAKYKAIQAEWRANNKDYARDLSKAWRNERDLIVTPRAINRRQPWTKAELEIALNPELTLTEAAIRLGRTVSAVSNQRYKMRSVAS